MKKIIKIKTENGTTLFTKDVSSREDENRLKHKMKAKLLYDLLFLSKKYTDKDDAFDFIEFTDPSVYYNDSFVNENVFDYVNDVITLSREQKELLIKVNKKFRELITPNWWNKIVSDDKEWVELRETSRDLLKKLGIKYEEIDLDDFIEEYDL